MTRFATVYSRQSIIVTFCIHYVPLLIFIFFSVWLICGEWIVNPKYWQWQGESNYNHDQVINTSTTAQIVLENPKEILPLARNKVTPPARVPPSDDADTNSFDSINNDDENDRNDNHFEDTATSKSTSSSSSSPTTTTQSKQINPIQFFDIYPTGARLWEQHDATRRQRRRRTRHRHRTRRRLRQQPKPTEELFRTNGTFTDSQSILDTNEARTLDDFPIEWFHPQLRAVYATLQTELEMDNLDEEEDDGKRQQKRDDDDDDDNKNNARNGTTFIPSSDADAFTDFHRYRHLSRYERLLRTKFEWDLQPHFQGDDYNRHPHDQSYNNADQNNNSTNGTSSFTTSSSNGTTTSTNRRFLEGNWLIGGQFNQYQGVPLSQGYGTHYVHIWVGSPIPQRQSVIVDTGSHFTAFPCQGCQQCGREHHTDPYFDQEQSSTFKPLSCPQECYEQATCSPAPDLRCQFTQSYTEGSSWKAFQAKDVLYCGGPNVLEAASPLDRQYAMPFMFGCLEQETGLFITQLADGIMGLSAHETTLPKQLYNAGLLEYNMFAMCFRKELGTSKRGVTAGSMTLGGVSSTLDTSPMVYAKNTKSYGWFTVHVRNVFVSKNGGSQFLLDTPESIQDIVPIPVDEMLLNSGKGVIVDSGTTDTYLNADAAPAFVKLWKQVTGMEYSHGPIYLSTSQLQRLPTVLVQMQAAVEPGGGSSPPTPLAASTTTTASSTPGASSNTASSTSSSSMVVGQVGLLDPEHPSDVLLAIPASHYMEYSPSLRLYTSRLYFTETRGGVLGANAMQGHNILFDWQHGRIGFSQSTCEYDLISTSSSASSSSSSSATQGKFSSTKKQQQQQQQRPSESTLLEHERNTFKDCIFSTPEPTLTRSCLESVSVEHCPLSTSTKATHERQKTDQESHFVVVDADDDDDNEIHDNYDIGNDVELSGTEHWTWLIAAPGAAGSCQETAREWSSSQRKGKKNQASSSGMSTTTTPLQPPTTTSATMYDLPSKVNCTQDGICMEYRPCRVACSDVVEFYDKYTSMMATTSSASSSLSSSWSPSLGGSDSVSNTLQQPNIMDIIKSSYDDAEDENGQKQGTTGEKIVVRNDKNTSTTAAAANHKNNICGDSYWSACDYNCRQSRILSKQATYPYDAFSTQQQQQTPRHHHLKVCVEISRQSRPCHIDACGRNDPCIVPFLVHAILVFETDVKNSDNDVIPKKDLDEWTPEIVELFRNEFTRVSHLPEFSSMASRRNLFQQGDIDILVVRPWIHHDGSDDVDNDNSIKDDSDDFDKGDKKSGKNEMTKENGAAHSSNEDVTVATLAATKEGIRGKSKKNGTADASRKTQVIIQVSIFNPNAKKLPKDNSRYNHNDDDNERKLLQEIGVLWTNLTQPFRTPKPESTCDPSDLYPLARDAVELANGILEHKDFGRKLVENSILSEYYHNSRVVSAWTIGTEVYDDHINYNGPTTPLHYYFFRILYEIAVLVFICSILSCIMQVCYKLIHRHRLFLFFRRTVYIQWNASPATSPSATTAKTNGKQRRHPRNNLWFVLLFGWFFRCLYMFGHYLYRCSYVCCCVVCCWCSDTSMSFLKNLATYTTMTNAHTTTTNEAAATTTTTVSSPSSSPAAVRRMKMVRKHRTSSRSKVNHFFPTNDDEEDNDADNDDDDDSKNIGLDEQNPSCPHHRRRDYDDDDENFHHADTNFDDNGEEEEEDYGDDCTSLTEKLMNTMSSYYHYPSSLSSSLSSSPSLPHGRNGIKKSSSSDDTSAAATTAIIKHKKKTKPKPTQMIVEVELSNTFVGENNHHHHRGLTTSTTMKRKCTTPTSA